MSRNGRIPLLGFVVAAVMMLAVVTFSCFVRDVVAVFVKCLTSSG
jgi:hypothetical protein